MIGVRIFGGSRISLDGDEPVGPRSLHDLGARLIWVARTLPLDPDEEPSISRAVSARGITVTIGKTKVDADTTISAPDTLTPREALTLGVELQRLARELGRQVI